MADNLQIQEQINALIKERQKVLAKITTQLERQAQLSKAISGAKPTRGAAGSVRETKRALEEAVESANNFKGASRDAALEAAQSLAKSRKGAVGFTGALKQAAKQFPVLGAAAGFAADMIGKVFSGIGGILSGAFSVITSVVGAIWNVGKAILALPGQIYGFLLEDAKIMYDYWFKTAEALEKVRGQFGSLATSIGKDVVTAVANFNTTAGAGINAMGVLGRDAAERYQNMAAMMGGLGGVISNFSGELAKNAGKIFTMSRGLGMANEDLETMGQYALSSGRTMTNVLEEISVYADQMGKQFGVSAVLIGKDMAAMTKNVGAFGTMSVKQMGEASVYARKLGVDVTKLAGTFDQFDNFESAATGAAKLSQAFGANVDVLKMMNAETPQDQIEQLRKSMRAAGKDAATMTRQELKLLASTTGLDVATARQVFSWKNQGKSLKDIKKKSDDVAKQKKDAIKATKMQAEAIGNLTKNIEKMLQKMDLGKGAFDQLGKGFTAGFKFSDDYMRILGKVVTNQKLLFRWGQKLGKLFITSFPGIKKVLKGIADFLDPAVVNANLQLVYDAFARFLGPGGSIGTLFNELSEIIMPGGAGDLGEGMKEMLTRAAEWFGQFAGWALAKLAKGMTALWEFIENPTETLAAIGDGAVKAGNATKSFGTTMMENLVKGFKDEKGLKAWDKLFGKGGVMGKIADKLGRLLADAVKAALGYLWDDFTGGSAWKKAGYMAVVAVFMPGKMLIGKALWWVGKQIFGGIKGIVNQARKLIPSKRPTKALGKGAKSLIPRVSAKGAQNIAKYGVMKPSMWTKLTKGASGFSKALGRVGGKLAMKGGLKTAAKAIPFVGIAVAIADAGYTMSKNMDKYHKDFSKQYGEIEARAGIGTASIIDSVTLGLMPQEWVEDIAKFFSSFYKTMWGGFEKIFGKDFTAGAKQLWGSVFKTLEGLGDIIVGIFTLDGDKILKGMGKIGEAMWDQIKGVGKMIWGGLKRWFGCLKNIFTKHIPYIIGYAIGKLVQFAKWWYIDLPTAIWKFIASIPEKFDEFVTYVGNMASNAYTAFKQMFTDMKKAWDEFDLLKWANDMGTKFTTYVGNMASDAYTAFKQMFTDMKQAWNEFELLAWANDMGTKFTTWFADTTKSFVDWGAGILGDILEGIKSAPGQAWAGIKGLGVDVLNSVKAGYDDAAESHSPSRVWMSTATNMASSLALGVENSAGILKNAGKEMVTSLDDGTHMGSAPLAGLEQFMLAADALAAKYADPTSLASVQVIQALVDNVNHISTALGKVNRAKVDVQLRTLADHLQLGGKDSFLIKNNKLNLHIDVKVAISAQELESALLGMPTGRIATIDQ